MKGAEWRSPVQRVMSTQSRAWFRRVRREERGARTRGSVGERERTRGAWVLSLRWSVCESSCKPESIANDNVLYWSAIRRKHVRS